jgi:hypothetical protein
MLNPPGGLAGNFDETELVNRMQAPYTSALRSFIFIPNAFVTGVFLAILLAAYYRTRCTGYVEKMLQRFAKAYQEGEQLKTRQRFRKECDALYDRAVVDSASKGVNGMPDSKYLRALIEGHFTKGVLPMNEDMQLIVDLVFAAGIALDKDKVFELMRFLHTMKEREEHAVAESSEGCISVAGAEEPMPVDVESALADQAAAKVAAAAADAARKWELAVQARRETMPWSCRY